MAARLVFAAEAELDVSEAYAWYETRRPGLGENFLSSVDLRGAHLSPTGQLRRRS